MFFINMFIQDDIIEYLKNKNLISQITNEKSLIKNISEKSISLYCGFDPTFDSLHIGHLLPLLLLRFFQKNGHKPIVLIGGSTALVGDPSFKFSKRETKSAKIIREYTKKIRKQISLFLDFNCGKNSAKIINNNVWFKNINLINFLCNIGKYFSVNKMMSKDAIKTRFYKSQYGISFSEFSYNLLQSYDYFKLYSEYNVKLQIGGSDQWGNIISGVNLIKNLCKKEAFGLTFPIITDSNGSKIGKTENNNIVWLDPKKTSSYDFYQFWINIDDICANLFLEFFKPINSNEKKYNEIPEFKYVLAEKITKLIHGKQKSNFNEKITKKLFSKNFTLLTKNDFENLIKIGFPTVNSSINSTLQDVLVKSNLFVSKNKAREIIKSSGIKINNRKCLDEKYIFSYKDIIFNKYSLIKRGKRKFCLIIWNKN